MGVRIRKGDFVIVHTGFYKGHKGEVLSVNKKISKAIVSGINIVKRHQKSQNQPGSIIEKESYIHISNIALFDASCDAKSKIGFRLNESGKKVRFFKKSNLEVK